MKQNKSERRVFAKGHDFSRAERAVPILRGLQPLRQVGRAKAETSAAKAGHWLRCYSTG